MEIKEYVEKIVDNGKVEDMHELSNVLEDVMEELCNYNEEMYKKYEMRLYQMAYGKVLSKTMAEEIVWRMKPYKMRWSMDDTKKIQEEFGMDNIRPVDFFIVMNAAYNDYKDLFNEDIEMYVRFTQDFILDDDAKEGKVFTYFTTIPE